MELTEENRLRRRLTPANRFIGCVVACALMLLVVVAPGQGKLSTPVPTVPANGVSADSVPWFAWTAVPGAAAYEFQIAADAGMNSPVLGRGKDHFQTRNLRATLTESIPNGTYYWRVRAVTKTGDISAWSRVSSFTKRLSGAAIALAPPPGTVVNYLSEPLKLSWGPAVTGAASYQLRIGTDPSFGSLIGGGPIETVGTSFTLGAAMPPGTYYWDVTPIDAQGNPGVKSNWSSFQWHWPSLTNPTVTDLAPESEVYDPQFSWDRVLGAARYEVEVNSSQDFAPGSKVCCALSTTATSLSPTTLFKDNVYYWRVRALDTDGNAGDWNLGPSFTKTFDKLPPVGPVTLPSIKNFHIRDNLDDPGVDQIETQVGYQTHVPILVWDRVPGASSYQVEVTPWISAISACDWAASDRTRWQVITATTAWTPLGTPLGGNPPFGNPTSVATENNATHLLNDQKYCARVRAQSDRDNAGKQIFGDYTDLQSNVEGWAFQWIGAPPSEGRSAGCNSGVYLCEADYVSVQRGATMTRMPFFTWRPVAGKESYFVIVAKDAAFTNIVDYAFTQLPAYAPRTGFQATTYPDETTLYYWVVLPAVRSDGTISAAGSPVLGSPGNFQKRSQPPLELKPRDGEDVSDQPIFQWISAEGQSSSIEGARRYRLQVAQDPSFANLIDDVTTDSTAYTSDTSYPADTVLYWRVRAEDENHVGLSWSCERDAAAGCTAGNTKKFRKLLRKPEVTSKLIETGDYIPTWTWKPTAGAVSYDVAADLPDGTHRDLKGIRTPAFTPTLMYGTGVFRWSVRANFPTLTSRPISGPYSDTASFTRTIGEPGGAHADVSKKHILLLWEPKAGAKAYNVEISERRDFARLVERVTTDNTSYAPLLTKSPYERGGPLYWRVAAIDGGRNVGDFTPARQIARPKTMRLVASGALTWRRPTTVTITVRDPQNHPLRVVAVRVAGAGVRPGARRTNANGRVTFHLRATRRGTVTYRATKTGYEPAVLKQRVR
jgi:hypothetical protein